MCLKTAEHFSDALLYIQMNSFKFFMFLDNADTGDLMIILE